MVEPILMALREFDGKQPCMGRAWLLMKTLDNMSYHYKINHFHYHLALHMCNQTSILPSMEDVND
jgi:hypothetical protein